MSDSNLSPPSSPPPARRIKRDEAGVEWAIEDHETFELHHRLTPVPARRLTSAPPLMVKRVEKAPMTAMPLDARTLTPVERSALGHLYIAEVRDFDAAERILAGLSLTVEARDRVLTVWHRVVR